MKKKMYQKHRNRWSQGGGDLNQPPPSFDDFDRSLSLPNFNARSLQRSLKMKGDIKEVPCAFDLALFLITPCILFLWLTMKDNLSN